MSVTGEITLPQPITFSNERSNQPSRITMAKAGLTKMYLEKHFANMFNGEKNPPVGKNGSPEKDGTEKKDDLPGPGSPKKRIMNRTWRENQFVRCKEIGRGAFGEVWVVRDKNDGKIYAMKILDKADLIKKNQISNTLAEQNYLSSGDSPWVVQLIASFQDSKKLYFLMEYLPGGDLMGLLIKKNILTETETRFLIAETLLAINCVHQNNFIHRDIKPDNLLLTKNGHIKLIDFGLSTNLNKDDDPLYQYIEELTGAMNLSDSQPNRKLLTRRDQALSAVGSPNYIAPEILMKHPYTKSIDFWSLGAIMYEMLFGIAPFESDSPMETAYRIIHWKEYLKFPKNIPVSNDSISLMKGLICDPDERLDFEAIKTHRFFSGINWNNIQNELSPCKPQLTDDTDTSNFGEFSPRNEEKSKKTEKQTDDIARIAFLGFELTKKSRPKSLKPGEIQPVYPDK